MTGGVRDMRRRSHESELTPLHELAAQVGILSEYLDQTGQETRVTSDDTRRAILFALGIDATTDAAAQTALAILRDEDDRRLIAPVQVVEHGSASLATLDVRVPPVRSKSGPWRLELVTENGETHVTEGPWRGDSILRLALAPGIPLGYHRLRLSLSAGGEEWSAEQQLIVVPSRCVTPGDVVGDRSVFGLIANLYSVRSRTNWGIGDFSDLGELAAWTGEAGGDFVGVNPLHALLNRGRDISPYGPVSRLFRNPIYIDVARVPELEHAPELRRRLASPEFASEIEALREHPDVRYEQVMAVKGLALDALHRLFSDRVRGSGNARDRDYDEYVTRHDPGLTRFATWMAIAESQAGNGNGDGRSAGWRIWPEELRSPDSAGVERFAAAHAQRVDFHCWLQFEADRQLAAASYRARESGMQIGLYQDLAIGTSPAGADAWAYPDLFVRGVSIGAPPDPYAATGQNWGLPPINPRALQQTGYRYFVDLLRTGFRHSGALRIDHVLGLFRMFWIPEGESGTTGAYVQYPTSDLLGIIALESVRHNALVVGEDLGTVPEEVPPTLEKWGILSSKVLYFERDSRGRFRAAHTYQRLALATVNTHDMATINGFWQGRDIDVRRSVGLLDSDEAAEDAREERERDRSALLERLVEETVLPSPHMPRSSSELRGAVHAFVCRTPSQLVGIALDDLAGEVDPVNVPGVGPEKYPCWTRKMRDNLETLMLSSEVRTALRCDGRVRSARTMRPQESP